MNLSRETQKQSETEYYQKQQHIQNGEALRIGHHDPVTGLEKVIYPTNCEVISGVRTFNSSCPYGTVVRGMHAPNSQVISLDYHRHLPISSTAEISKKPKQGALIAFASNYFASTYITGPEEAEIIVSLTAQLLGDTKGKERRRVACFIGPTYTPQGYIIEVLKKYNYIPEFVTSAKNLDGYDIFIARVVTIQGVPVFDEEEIKAIKQMVNRGKACLLGGCGCPYGADGLNHALRMLGLDWRVSMTRGAPMEVTSPWQIINKKNRNTVTINPSYLTDRTCFSGVKKNEILALSANNKVVMAYTQNIK